MKWPSLLIAFASLLALLVFLLLEYDGESRDEPQRAAVPTIVTSHSGNPQPLLTISISPESRVKASAGPAKPTLVKGVRLIIHPLNEFGVIEKGIRFRILIGGVPLARASDPLPILCPPLSPMVVWNEATEFHLPLHNLKVAAGDGSVHLVEGNTDSLVRYSSAKTVLSDSLTWPLQLRRDQPMSSQTLSLAVESGAWSSLRPTVVFNFERVEAKPLADLLDGAWSRLPSTRLGWKPEGRPLWESSLSLCDRADSSDEGVGIPMDADQMFRSKHLNQRRTLFGSIERSGKTLPALWKQRAENPLVLSEIEGFAMGANDHFVPEVVGATLEKGQTKPALWRKDGNGWKCITLPMMRFTTKGIAHDVNDEGVICGFIELLPTSKAARLPCVWHPGSDGTFAEAKLLPLPSDATGGGAVAINNLGVVTGFYLDAKERSVACYWKPSGSGFQIIDLETFGVARGINDINQIVGGSDVSAYLWQGEQRIDLSDIPGAPEQSRAMSISAWSDIMVEDPLRRRVLLQPLLQK